MSGINLYAWTNSSYGTIYTSSETPSSGDTLYDAQGQAITSIAGVIGNISLSSYDSVTNAISIYGEKI